MIIFQKLNKARQNFNWIQNLPRLRHDAVAINTQDACHKRVSSSVDKLPYSAILRSCVVTSAEAN